MNDTSPLVSIIIPCYNVSAYVEKAVQSILDQTYFNLEIFIIDDASTDDTLQKINSFKDERIHVITFKENTQKVGAVNEVLKKANGVFIAFEDADDWSEPTRIQDQLNEFFKDSELGICFTNYRYVRNKTFLPGKISLTNEDLSDEFLNYNLNRDSGNSPTICGTMMISKAALKKTVGYHPFFAGRVAEDIHWIYRILKDFKGVTIDKVLYNYTLRQNSLTRIMASGLNAKYAYSCQLLSKIINKDIKESVDVLAPENIDLLRNLELEACEEALTETIQKLHSTTKLYKSSNNFKIGKFFLAPYRLMLKFFNK